MTSLDRTLSDIERKYGSKVARAFSDAIADIRDGVVMKRVIAAVERGDITGAMDALNIDESAFSGLRQQLAAAFNESGAAVVAGTRFDPPGETRGVVRWNSGNPQAVRALNEWLSDKITQITEDTRAAVRSALSEAFSGGKGPRQIALDIVGRVGPNGRRTGGVIGLTSQGESNVSTMRTALGNDGFTDANGRKVFWIKRDGTLGTTLTKRDRRFDRTILKLLREGKAATAMQIDKWTGRYADKLLKLRGDTIARTETAAAVEQARFDGFRQGMDAKGYPYKYAIKKWRHGGGGLKPRVQHVHENETEVEGLYTMFRMPDGTLLLYPHDPNAPPGHVVNCTCSLLVRIDWARMKRDGII